jgi:hypothetical protein
MVGGREEELESRKTFARKSVESVWLHNWGDLI